MSTLTIWNHKHVKNLLIISGIILQIGMTLPDG